MKRTAREIEGPMAQLFCQNTDRRLDIGASREDFSDDS